VLSSRVFAAGLFVATVTSHAPLAAQARSQITPFFTAFFAALPYAKDIGNADERLTSAPGVGVRATIKVASQVSVDGQFAYVFSGRQAKLDADPPIGVFIPGNAIYASGRVNYHPRRSNFRGFVGAGYQKLGGDAWDEDNVGSVNSSSVGGILGFGARANISQTLALDLTVESFLHSSDPGDYGSKEFQADIMLTVGIPIGFGGN